MNTEPKTAEEILEWMDKHLALDEQFEIIPMWDDTVIFHIKCGGTWQRTTLREALAAAMEETK